MSLDKNKTDLIKNIYLLKHLPKDNSSQQTCTNDFINLVEYRLDSILVS